MQFAVESRNYNNLIDIYLKLQVKTINYMNLIENMENKPKIYQMEI